MTTEDLTYISKAIEIVNRQGYVQSGLAITKLLYEYGKLVGNDNN